MSVADFKLQYQVSPIFLTGGIASNQVGGTTAMPIVTLLQDNSLSGINIGDANLDDFFAYFEPAPGTGTIIANQIGAYPFANQAVAANAIIAQPLVISMIMICPARTPGSYSTKLATISQLQATLAQHTNAGGTFIVATPAFTYFDCILTAMRDVGGGESRQVQFRWQMDFVKPLLTLSDAQQAQNSFMSKVGTGSQVSPNANGTWPLSGPASAVGNANSGQAPSATPLGAAGTGLGFGNITTDQIVAMGGT